MVECGEVKQVDAHKPLPASPEKVTQNFVNLIEQHAAPPDTKTREESDQGSDVSRGHDLSGPAMTQMLNKLSEKTIDGCVRILEQLHIAESALESE